MIFIDIVIETLVLQTTNMLKLYISVCSNFTFCVGPIPSCNFDLVPVICAVIKTTLG